MKDNAIGKRIMELCEQQEITVNALAVKSYIPPSTLKNVVYGQVRSTRVETIEKLCVGFNISLQEFFNSSLF